MIEENNEWGENDYKHHSLENPSDRLGFIRKVYLLLFVQLLITALLVMMGALSEGFRDFVYDNWWIMLVSFFLSLIPLLLLFFVKSFARTVPINYCLLFLFTLLDGFTLACITTFYEPGVILIAFGCTAALTGGLTMYAWLTKTDFTKLYGIMIVVGFALMGFLLIIIIFGSDDVYRLIFCPIAIVFYGVYLIIDTQYIIGKGKYGLGYDDYVLGVVALYIDIVGMFSYLLELIGG